MAFSPDAYGPHVAAILALDGNGERLMPLAGGACPAGQLSFFGLGEMLVFMAILLAGYIYVWKKGALQWD